MEAAMSRLGKTSFEPTYPIDGISFIEHISFKVFNEGIRLKDCIRMHQKLINVRVRCVAADSIYANNRGRKSVQNMGYQPPLYVREELQRTRRWGRFSGVNSPGKEPPGLKAVSVRKNRITHYRKSKHGTGKQKSCGFSLEYIRQMPYWWLIKSKTDRRKLHSISIKNLLKEVSGFFRNIVPKRRRF